MPPAPAPRAQNERRRSVHPPVHFVRDAVRRSLHIPEHTYPKSKSIARTANVIFSIPSAAAIRFFRSPLFYRLQRACGK